MWQAVWTYGTSLSVLLLHMPVCKHNLLEASRVVRFSLACREVEDLDAAFAMRSMPCSDLEEVDTEDRAWLIETFLLKSSGTL